MAVLAFDNAVAGLQHRSNLKLIDPRKKNVPPYILRLIPNAASFFFQQKNPFAIKTDGFFYVKY